jgi:hypothetical protein
LWRVLSTSQPNFFPTNNVPYLRPLVEFYGSALVSLSTIAPSTITLSLTGMLKALIISTLQFDIVNTSFIHHRCPTDTTILLPDNINPEALLPGARFMEAKISMVAEFLQGCSADLSPYRAAETLHYVLTIGSIPVYRGRAHEAHQIQQGHAMASQSKAKAPRAELLAAVISAPIFNIHAGLPPPVQYDLSGLELASIPAENYTWLDSPTARAVIDDVLAHVCQWPTFIWKDEAVLTRMQAIIQGLDSLHVSPASTPLS